MTEFSVIMSLQGKTTGNSWLGGGHFFDGRQSYMKNKSEGNENKIILGDFNCIMDKTDRDGGNKRQRLFRCGSNYALPKLVMDNEL